MLYIASCIYLWCFEFLFPLSLKSSRDFVLVALKFLDKMHQLVLYIYNFLLIRP